MNKFFALLLAVVMVLSLCACGNDGEKSNDDGNKSGAGDNSPTTVPTTPAAPTDPADDRVELNVFAGVTVMFKPAMNGFGESITVEFDHTNVNYDKSNTDIKNFLQSIEFSHNDYINLSNGDEIVVNASWSKSTAEALGVKLMESSHVYTVVGLYDVYRSSEELPKDLKEIDGIKGAIVEEIEDYMDYYDWFDGYDATYRYYSIYAKDQAGNAYVSMIYITAVVNFDAADDTEDRTVRFRGYNYLYQEYWEMRMYPQAEESDRVSETGELDQVGGALKQEEFFLN